MIGIAHAQAAIVETIVLIDTSVAAEPAGDEPTALTAVTDICKEIDLLTQIWDELTERIERFEEAEQELVTDCKLLNLAAAKHYDTTSKRTYTVLEATAKTRRGTDFTGLLNDYAQQEPLKASASLHRATAELILNKQNVADLNTLKDDIDTTIDAVFGKSQSEYTDRFWGKLKEVNVDKEAAGIEATTLDRITSIAALNRATSYYFMTTARELQNKIAALEAKNSKSEVKSIEQICNSKEDADTCQNDKNCTYDDTKADGKKCTLNEEGKQAAEKEAAHQTGTDGKPTNSTGSNSFVVNKAPLLLAFLLLQLNFLKGYCLI
uniref:Variant surface glycoprotein 1700 n=1 Tax=Trypanosoma brucei TaxID=5691 RepID=M4SW25_9TRYP|nr:variant surface glycoprotein 1700 [Trypanosoma brucei]